MWKTEEGEEEEEEGETRPVSSSFSYIGIVG